MPNLKCPVKVLHVYRTYFPDTQGGGQELIRQICHNTQKHGIESRVFFPSRNPTPNVLKVDETSVYRVKLEFEIASCGFCFGGIGEFRRQVEWADVIHYYFPWPFADVMHFIARPKKPTISTHLSDIVRQQGVMTLYRPLMNKFLSDISVIVATSPQYLSSSETLRPHRGKSRVIPIGIDEESYPEVPDELMSSLEQTHGSGFFFFVGVLRYYKCLDVLLKASADQDFKVIIAGEGPLEDTLKKEAKAIGLYNVQFVGRISDEEKIAFIKLSRAIVFPSFIRAESFGITLLEGAMYEKPLVTADVESGMNYVNIDRVTGLVVEGNSPLALREALVELDRDPKLAEALGAGARERYDELFSGEVMGKNYAALYQELVTGTLS